MSEGKGPYRIIDGSTPASALLYESEELVTSQDGVGLYDGKEKTPGRQNGTVHLTTHRLLYVDATHASTHSLALSLSFLRQSEYYAGFLSSSPKVTLYLKDHAILCPFSDESPPIPSDEALLGLNSHAPGPSWVCPVCSYSNPAAVDDNMRPKCALCGVPRDPLAYAASKPSRISTIHRSPSMPTLRHTTPIPVDGVSPPPEGAADSTIADNELNTCSTCTYLNHHSMKYCEICGTPLPFKSPSGLRAPPSRSSGSTPMLPSVDLPTAATLRVSFRKGGDKVFYGHLKKVLQARVWEDGGFTPRMQTKSEISYNGAPTRMGIQGIFDALDLNARAADTNLQGNVHDLEVLMAKAKEMVEFASSLNAKLTIQEEELERRRAMFPGLPASLSKATQPEEATFIRSSLAQLGLPTVAVTQDMVNDGDKYHEELAKELAGVLTGRNTKGRALMGSEEGIIGLDEVWGGWNRARGIALIPPASLLMAAAYLPKYTAPPITLRVFRSGLRVLHTPKYSDEAFANQLESLLPYSPATTVEIAVHEHLNVGLAEEMIESIEHAGKVVRDEGTPSEQIRWYTNVLDTYEWDGQADASP